MLKLVFIFFYFLIFNRLSKMKNQKIYYYTFFYILSACLQSSKGFENETVFADVKGWSLFARFKDESTYQFFYTCNHCSHIKEGLKIKINFNRASTTYYWNPKFHERKRILDFTGSATLYHEYKYLKDDTFFTSDMSSVFGEYREQPSQLIKSFIVNNELIYSKSLDAEIPPENQSSCDPLINYHNITTNDSPSEKFSMTLKYFSKEEIPELVLTFLFQDDLDQVESADVFVMRSLPNLWILKNFGYFQDENKTLEVKMTITSNEMISNPVPILIILNGEVICRDFSVTDNTPIPAVMNETDITLVNEEMNYHEGQISILSIVLILFTVMIGVYAIVVTYFMMRWRRQVNTEINRKVTDYSDIEISDSSHKRNNANNLKITEYYTPFNNYALPEASQRY